MLVAPYRIGVDVGGTFTDLVLVDGQGAVRAFKVPSVPSNPTEGVLSAVQLAAQSIDANIEMFLRDTTLFVHGSTIATNTLLEKKGAKVGLLTTEGFRDSLEMRRGFREDVWDHRRPYPEVLVPRYLRLPVKGRLNVDGSVRTPFDPASVEAAIKVFAEEGVQAVAICLLHAYKNPAHELAAQDVVRRLLPDVWTTISSDVAPIIGEYERTSTTVVNAYVGPRVVPYLRQLDAQLSALGLPRGLLMVQSNGGSISVAEIDQSPVRLVLSGPAAGVGSLKFFGRDTKSDHLISIEVGGTSCDVTLMENLSIGSTDQLEIDGYHLSIPAVDIQTVGAGGGTIASVDSGGLFSAGPEGAGSVPGPASYGRGGTRPTVTDAQLVLGRLKPGPYAGGAIFLDFDKAARAIQTHIAEPLGIGIEDAAAGILQLVEQNILHAVEQASLERGYNPRLFTLVAAGGAGPLHGASTARLIGCASLYIPRLAGVFCAFGMCNSDLRQDYVQSWLLDLDDAAASGAASLEAAFGNLQTKGAEALSRQGFEGRDARFVRSYDMRYFGQQWPIAVECAATDPAKIRAVFEATYKRLFGYIQQDGQIEIVNLRLAAIGKLAPLEVAAVTRSAKPAKPVSYRRVWVDKETGVANVPIFDGPGLKPGQEFSGPAVIEEATTTIFVGAGDTVRITDASNYHVSIAPR